MNNAFTSVEQTLIQSTTVTADKNLSYSTSPGNNTIDKIFLLSIPEVTKYFTTDSARYCTPTAYAKAQGAYTRSNNCWWWLRTPGSSSYYASYVYTDGSILYFGDLVHNERDAVRPAMWINLG